MIILYFLLLCSWGYGVSRFLLRSKGNRFYIFYPLGLATVGLIVSTLWFLGFQFFQVSLAIQAVGWTLLPLLISDIWIRMKRRKWNQKKWMIEKRDSLLRTQFTFFDFPWLLLAVISIFSAAILTLWMWNVLPIHWDNISLYDYRAHNIVNGWHRMTFLENAASHPMLHMYDWQHPWFSSFVLALGYSFGANNPLALYWFLGVSLVWHAFATWKSWQTRVMFVSVLVLMPSIFTAFTEGYGVFLATMFWGHFFLFTQKTSQLTWKDTFMLMVFSGAAMQSRMVEPFWFVFGMCFVWYYKRQLLLSLAVFFTILGWHAEWSFFVRQAQAYYSLLASDLDPVQGFLRFDPRTFLLSSYFHLAFTFLSSTATQMGLLIFSVWLVARKKLSSWWSTQAFALFLSLGILLGGMALFALPGTDGWKEIRHALPRASMPLVLLGSILLCDLYQQWRDSSRMK